MDPLSVFAEYGAIGVVILLFAGQIVFLQKTLMGKLNEIEEISIKLIDRWNKADEARDRRHEDVLDNADRRHEKLTFELRTQSESLNFLRGKLDKQ